MAKLCCKMHYMDHEVLSSELVRALRGTRSQGALNRRLGRSSNVAHTWERGSRQPRASDFLLLAELARLPVGAILAGFAAVEAPSSRGFGAADVGAWLSAVARGRSHAELARKVGCDRNTVARWLGGKTEPRLPDLLRLVDATTQRLMDFVAAFVDPRGLPSLKQAFEDLERQRRLAYDLPWAHAVLRVLELEDYASLARHEAGQIAARIGIGVEQETECIEALAAAGQIQRRRGKWTVRRVLTVDTREDPAANLRLKRHWTKVALERLGEDALAIGGLFSYNLFAISNAGLDEIREAHVAYYERVRSIVRDCQRPTRLALVNVQLLPLEPGAVPSDRRSAAPSSG
jgi:transcriptional regulator with XRE-family HTH domain